MDYNSNFGYQSISVDRSIFWTIHRIAHEINKKLYKLPEERLFLELEKIDPIYESSLQSIVFVKDREDGRKLFVCHYLPFDFSPPDEQHASLFPIIQLYKDRNRCIVCFDVSQGGSIRDLIINFSRVETEKEVQKVDLKLKKAFYQTGKFLARSHSKTIQNENLPVINQKSSSLSMIDEMFSRIASNDKLCKADPRLRLSSTYLNGSNETIFHTSISGNGYTYPAKVFMDFMLECKVLGKQLGLKEESLDSWLQQFMIAYQLHGVTSLVSKEGLLFFAANFWSRCLINMKNSNLKNVYEEMRHYLVHKEKSSLLKIEKYLREEG